MYRLGYIILFCFYPRDAMLSRVFARATCPSVRLSHAGIVSKRRKCRDSFTFW